MRKSRSRFAIAKWIARKNVSPVRVLEICNRSDVSAINKINLRPANAGMLTERGGHPSPLNSVCEEPIQDDQFDNRK